MNTYYYTVETVLTSTGESTLSVFSSDEEMTEKQLWSWATDWVNPELATLTKAYQTHNIERIL
jgi:hypothetical protein